jgi:hypothetical protein
LKIFPPLHILRAQYLLPYVSSLIYPFLSFLIAHQEHQRYISEPSRQSILE